MDDSETILATSADTESNANMKDKEDIVRGFIKEKELIESAHKEEIEGVKSRFEEEKEKLKQELEAEKDGIMEEYKAKHMEEKSKFQYEAAKTREAIGKELHSKETRLMQQHKEEIRKLKREYEKIVQDKRNEIRSLSRDVEMFQQKALEPDSVVNINLELDILEEKHENEVEIMKNDHEREVAGLHEEFQYKLAEHERELKREKANFVQTLGKDAEKLYTDFEAEKAKMKEDHQNELNMKLETVERLLCDQAEADKKRMIKRFEEEMIQVEEELKQDTTEKLFEKHKMIVCLEREKEDLMHTLHLERFSLARVYNREMSLLTKPDPISKEDLEVALIDEVAKVRHEYDTQIQSMEARHRQELKAIRKSHRPLEEIEAKHKKDVQEMARKWEQEKDDLEAKLRREQFNLLKSFEFEKQDSERMYGEIMNNKEAEFTKNEADIRNEYEKDIEELTTFAEERHKVKEELEKEKERNTDLEDLIEELKSKKAILEDDVEREGRHSQRLEMEMAGLGKKLEELRPKDEDSLNEAPERTSAANEEYDLEDIQRKLGIFAEERHRLSEELRNDKQRITDLEDQIEELISNKAILQDDLDRESRKCRQLEMEIVGLERKIEDMCPKDEDPMKDASESTSAADEQGAQELEMILKLEEYGLGKKREKELLDRFKDYLEKSEEEDREKDSLKRLKQEERTEEAAEASDLKVREDDIHLEGKVEESTASEVGSRPTDIDCEMTTLEEIQKISTGYQDKINDLRSALAAMNEEIELVKDNLYMEKKEFVQRVMTLRADLSSAVSKEEATENQNQLEDLQASNKRFKDAINEHIQQLDSLCGSNTSIADIRSEKRDDSNNTSARKFSDAETYNVDELLGDILTEGAVFDKEIKDKINECVRELMLQVQREHDMQKLETERKHMQEKSTLLEELTQEKKADLKLSEEVFRYLQDKYGSIEKGSLKELFNAKDGETRKTTKEEVKNEVQHEAETEQRTNDKDVHEKRSESEDETVLEELRQEKEDLKRALGELESNFNKEKEGLMAKLCTQHKEFVMNPEAEMMESLLKERLVLEHICNVERFYLSRLYYSEMKDELEEILAEKNNKTTSENLKIVLKFEREISDLQKTIVDNEDREVRLMEDKEELMKQLLESHRRSPIDRDLDKQEEEHLKFETARMEATIPLKEEIADLQNKRHMDHETTLTILKEAYGLIQDLMKERSHRGNFHDNLSIHSDDSTSERESISGSSVGREQVLPEKESTSTDTVGQDEKSQQVESEKESMYGDAVEQAPRQVEHEKESMNGDVVEQARESPRQVQPEKESMNGDTIGSHQKSPRQVMPEHKLTSGDTVVQGRISPRQVVPEEELINRDTVGQDWPVISDDEITNQQELRKALEDLIESVMQDNKDVLYDSEATSGASSDVESDTSQAPTEDEMDEFTDSGAELIESETLTIKKANLDLALNLERFNLGRVYYTEYRDSLRKATSKLTQVKDSLQSKERTLEKGLIDGVGPLVDKTRFGKASSVVPTRDEETQTISDEENTTLVAKEAYERVPQKETEYPPAEAPREENVDSMKAEVTVERKHESEEREGDEVKGESAERTGLGAKEEDKDNMKVEDTVESRNDEPEERETDKAKEENAEKKGLGAKEEDKDNMKVEDTVESRKDKPEKRETDKAKQPDSEKKGLGPKEEDKDNTKVEDTVESRNNESEEREGDEVKGESAERTGLGAKEEDKDNIKVEDTVESRNDESEERETDKAKEENAEKKGLGPKEEDKDNTKVEDTVESRNNESEEREGDEAKEKNAEKKGLGAKEEDKDNMKVEDTVESRKDKPEKRETDKAKQPDSEKKGLGPKEEDKDNTKVEDTVESRKDEPEKREGDKVKGESAERTGVGAKEEDKDNMKVEDTVESRNNESEEREGDEVKGESTERTGLGAKEEDKDNIKVEDTVESRNDEPEERETDKAKEENAEKKGLGPKEEDKDNMKVEDTVESRKDKPEKRETDKAKQPDSEKKGLGPKEEDKDNTKVEDTVESRNNESEEREGDEVKGESTERTGLGAKEEDKDNIKVEDTVESRNDEPEERETDKAKEENAEKKGLGPKEEDKDNMKVEDTVESRKDKPEKRETDKAKQPDSEKKGLGPKEEDKDNTKVEDTVKSRKDEPEEREGDEVKEESAERTGLGAKEEDKDNTKVEDTVKSRKDEPEEREGDEVKEESAERTGLGAKEEDKDNTKVEDTVKSRKDEPEEREGDEVKEESAERTGLGAKEEDKDNTKVEDTVKSRKDEPEEREGDEVKEESAEKKGLRPKEEDKDNMKFEDTVESRNDEPEEREVDEVKEESAERTVVGPKLEDDDTTKIEEESRNNESEEREGDEVKGESAERTGLGAKEEDKDNMKVKDTVESRKDKPEKRETDKAKEENAERTVMEHKEEDEDSTPVDNTVKTRNDESEETEVDKPKEESTEKTVMEPKEEDEVSTKVGDNVECRNDKLKEKEVDKASEESAERKGMGSKEEDEESTKVEDTMECSNDEGKENEVDKAKEGIATATRQENVDITKTEDIVESKTDDPEEKEVVKAINAERNTTEPQLEDEVSMNDEDIMESRKDDPQEKEVENSKVETAGRNCVGLQKEDEDSTKVEDTVEKREEKEVGKAEEGSTQIKGMEPKKEDENSTKVDDTVESRKDELKEKEVDKAKEESTKRKGRGPEVEDEDRTKIDDTVESRKDESEEREMDKANGESAERTVMDPKESAESRNDEPEENEVDTAKEESAEKRGMELQDVEEDNKKVEDTEESRNDEPKDKAKECSAESEGMGLQEEDEYNGKVENTVINNCGEGKQSSPESEQTQISADNEATGSEEEKEKDMETEGAERDNYKNRTEEVDSRDESPRNGKDDQNWPPEENKDDGTKEAEVNKVEERDVEGMGTDSVQDGRETPDLNRGEDESKCSEERHSEDNQREKVSEDELERQDNEYVKEDIGHTTHKLAESSEVQKETTAEDQEEVRERGLTATVNGKENVHEKEEKDADEDELQYEKSTQEDEKAENGKERDEQIEKQGAQLEDVKDEDTATDQHENAQEVENMKEKVKEAKRLSEEPEQSNAAKTAQTGKQMTGEEAEPEDIQQKTAPEPETKETHRQKDELEKDADTERPHDVKTAKTSKNTLVKKEDTVQDKKDKKEDTVQDKKDKKEDTVQDKKDKKEDTVQDKKDKKEDTVQDKKDKKEDTVQDKKDKKEDTVQDKKDKKEDTVQDKKDKKEDTVQDKKDKKEDTVQDKKDKKEDTVQDKKDKKEEGRQPDDLSAKVAVGEGSGEDTERRGGKGIFSDGNDAELTPVQRKETIGEEIEEDKKDWQEQQDDEDLEDNGNGKADNMLLEGKEDKTRGIAGLQAEAVPQGQDDGQGQPVEIKVIGKKEQKKEKEKVEEEKKKDDDDEKVDKEQTPKPKAVSVPTLDQDEIEERGKQGQKQMKPSEEAKGPDTVQVKLKEAEQNRDETINIPEDVTSGAIRKDGEEGDKKQMNDLTRLYPEELEDKSVTKESTEVEVVPKKEKLEPENTEEQADKHNDAGERKSDSKGEKPGSPCNIGGNEEEHEKGAPDEIKSRQAKYEESPDRPIASSKIGFLAKEQPSERNGEDVSPGSGTDDLIKRLRNEKNQFKDKFNILRNLVGKEFVNEIPELCDDERISRKLNGLRTLDEDQLSRLYDEKERVGDELTQVEKEIENFRRSNKNDAKDVDDELNRKELESLNELEAVEKVLKQIEDKELVEHLVQEKEEVTKTLDEISKELKRKQQQNEDSNKEGSLVSLMSKEEFLKGEIREKEAQLKLMSRLQAEKQQSTAANTNALEHSIEDHIYQRQALDEALSLAQGTQKQRVSNNQDVSQHNRLPDGIMLLIREKGEIIRKTDRLCKELQKVKEDISRYKRMLEEQGKRLRPFQRKQSRLEEALNAIQPNGVTNEKNENDSPKITGDKYATEGQCLDDEEKSHLEGELHKLSRAIHNEVNKLQHYIPRRATSIKKQIDAVLARRPHIIQDIQDVDTGLALEESKFRENNFEDLCKLVNLLHKKNRIHRELLDAEACLKSLHREESREAREPGEGYKLKSLFKNKRNVRAALENVEEDIHEEQQNVSDAFKFKRTGQIPPEQSTSSFNKLLNEKEQLLSDLKKNNQVMLNAVEFEGSIAYDPVDVEKAAEGTVTLQLEIENVQERIDAETTRTVQALSELFDVKFRLITHLQTNEKELNDEIVRIKDANCNLTHDIREALRFYEAKKATGTDEELEETTKQRNLLEDEIKGVASLLKEARTSGKDPESFEEKIEKLIVDKIILDEQITSGIENKTESTTLLEETEEGLKRKREKLSQALVTVESEIAPLVETVDKRRVNTLDNIIRSKAKLEADLRKIETVGDLVKQKQRVLHCLGEGTARLSDELFSVTQIIRRREEDIETTTRRLKDKEDLADILGPENKVALESLEASDNEIAEVKEKVEEALTKFTHELEIHAKFSKEDQDLRDTVARLPSELERNHQELKLVEEQIQARNRQVQQGTAPSSDIERLFVQKKIATEYLDEIDSKLSQCGLDTDSSNAMQTINNNGNLTSAEIEDLQNQQRTMERNLKEIQETREKQELDLNDKEMEETVQVLKAEKDKLEKKRSEISDQILGSGVFAKMAAERDNRVHDGHNQYQYHHIESYHEILDKVVTEDLLLIQQVQKAQTVKVAAQRQRDLMKNKLDAVTSKVGGDLVMYLVSDPMSVKELPRIHQDVLDRTLETDASISDVLNDAMKENQELRKLNDKLEGDLEYIREKLGEDFANELSYPSFGDGERRFEDIIDEIERDKTTVGELLHDENEKMEIFEANLGEYLAGALLDMDSDEGEQPPIFSLRAISLMKESNGDLQNVIAAYEEQLDALKYENEFMKTKLGKRLVAALMNPNVRTLEPEKEQEAPLFVQQTPGGHSKGIRTEIEYVKQAICLGNEAEDQGENAQGTVVLESEEGLQSIEAKGSEMKIEPTETTDKGRRIDGQISCIKGNLQADITEEEKGQILYSVLHDKDTVEDLLDAQLKELEALRALKKMVGEQLTAELLQPITNVGKKDQQIAGVREQSLGEEATVSKQDADGDHGEETIDDAVVMKYEGSASNEQHEHRKDHENLESSKQRQEGLESETGQEDKTIGTLRVIPVNEPTNEPKGKTAFKRGHSQGKNRTALKAPKFVIEHHDTLADVIADYEHELDILKTNLGPYLSEFLLTTVDKYHAEEEQMETQRLDPVLQTAHTTLETSEDAESVADIKNDLEMSLEECTIQDLLEAQQKELKALRAFKDNIGADVTQEIMTSSEAQTSDDNKVQTEAEMWEKELNILKPKLGSTLTEASLSEEDEHGNERQTTNQENPIAITDKESSLDAQKAKKSNIQDTAPEPENEQASYFVLHDKDTVGYLLEAQLKELEAFKALKKVVGMELSAKLLQPITNVRNEGQNPTGEREQSLGEDVTLSEQGGYEDQGERAINNDDASGWTEYKTSENSEESQEGLESETGQEAKDSEALRVLSDTKDLEILLEEEGTIQDLLEAQQRELKALRALKDRVGEDLAQVNLMTNEATQKDKSDDIPGKEPRPPVMLREVQDRPEVGAQTNEADKFEKELNILKSKLGNTLTEALLVMEDENIKRGQATDEEKPTLEEDLSDKGHSKKKKKKRFFSLPFKKKSDKVPSLKCNLQALARMQEDSTTLENVLQVYEQDLRQISKGDHVQEALPTAALVSDYEGKITILQEVNKRLNEDLDRSGNLADENKHLTNEIENVFHILGPRLSSDVKHLNGVNRRKDSDSDHGREDEAKFMFNASVKIIKEGKTMGDVVENYEEDLKNLERENKALRRCVGSEGKESVSFFDTTSDNEKKLQELERAQKELAFKYGLLSERVGKDLARDLVESKCTSIDENEKHLKAVGIMSTEDKTLAQVVGNYEDELGKIKKELVTLQSLLSDEESGSGKTTTEPCTQYKVELEKLKTEFTQLEGNLDTFTDRLATNLSDDLTRDEHETQELEIPTVLSTTTEIAVEKDPPADITMEHEEESEKLKTENDALWQLVGHANNKKSVEDLESDYEIRLQNLRQENETVERDFNALSKKVGQQLVKEMLTPKGDSTNFPLNAPMIMAHDNKTLYDVVGKYEDDIKTLQRAVNALKENRKVQPDEEFGNSDEDHRITGQDKIKQMETLIGKVGKNLAENLMTAQTEGREISAEDTQLAAVEIMKKEGRSLEEVLETYEIDLKKLREENDVFKRLLSEDDGNERVLKVVASQKDDMDELKKKNKALQNEMDALSEKVGKEFVNAMLQKSRGHILGETQCTLDAFHRMDKEKSTLAKVVKDYENELKRLTDQNAELVRIKCDFEEVSKKAGRDLVKDILQIDSKNKEELKPSLEALSLMSDQGNTLEETVKEYENELRKLRKENSNFPEALTSDNSCVKSANVLDYEVRIENLNKRNDELSHRLDEITKRVGVQFSDELLHRNTGRDYDDSQSGPGTRYQDLEAFRNIAENRVTIAEVLRNYEEKLKSVESYREPFMVDEKDQAIEDLMGITINITTEPLVGIMPDKEVLLQSSQRQEIQEQETEEPEIQCSREAEKEPTNPSLIDQFTELFSPLEERRIATILPEEEKTDNFGSQSPKGKEGNKIDGDVMTEDFRSKIRELEENLQKETDLRKRYERDVNDLLQDIVNLKMEQAMEQDGEGNEEKRKEIQDKYDAERENKRLIHDLQSEKKRRASVEESKRELLYELQDVIQQKEKLEKNQRKKEETEKIAEELIKLRKTLAELQTRNSALTNEVEELKEKLKETEEAFTTEKERLIQDKEQEKAAMIKELLMAKADVELKLHEQLRLNDGLENQVNDLERELREFQMAVQGEIRLPEEKTDAKENNILEKMRNETLKEQLDDTKHAVKETIEKYRQKIKILETENVKKEDELRHENELLRNKLELEKSFAEQQRNDFDEILIHEREQLKEEFDNESDRERTRAQRDKENAVDEYKSRENKLKKELEDLQGHSQKEKQEMTSLFDEEFRERTEESRIAKNLPEEEKSDNFRSQYPKGKEGNKIDGDDATEDLGRKLIELEEKLQKETDLRERYEQDVNDLLQDIVNLKMEQAMEQDGEGNEEKRKEIQDKYDAERENKRLINDLQSEKKRRASVEESKRELLYELQDVIQQKEKLEKNEKKKQETEKIAEELIKLRKTLAELQTRNSALTNEVEELNEKLKETKPFITEKERLLQDKEQEKDAMIKELQISKGDVEQKLHKQLRVNDDFENQVNDLEKELEEFKMAVREETQVAVEKKEVEEKHIYDKMKNETLKEQLDDTEHVLKETIEKYRQEIITLETEKAKNVDELRHEIELLRNKLELEKSFAEQQRNDLDEMLRRERERLKDEFDNDIDRERTRAQRDMENAVDEYKSRENKLKKELEDLEEHSQKEKQEMASLFSEEKRKLQQTFDEEFHERTEKEKKQFDDTIKEMEREFEKQKEEIKSSFEQEKFDLRAEIEKELYEKLIKKKDGMEKEFQDILSKILKEHADEIKVVENEIKEAEERHFQEKKKVFEETEKEKKENDAARQQEKKAYESTIQNLLKEIVKLKQQRKEMRINYKAEQEKMEEMFEREKSEQQENWEKSKRDLAKKLQEEHSKVLEGERCKFEANIDELRQEQKASEASRKTLQDRLREESNKVEELLYSRGNDPGKIEKDRDNAAEDFKALKKTLEEDYEKRLKVEKQKHVESLQGLRREVANLQEKRRLIQEKVYNQEASSERRVIEKSIANYKKEVMSKLEEEFSHKIKREKRPLEDANAELRRENDELKQQRRELRLQLRKEQSRYEEDIERERERIENQFVKDKEQMRARLESKLLKEQTKKTAANKVSRALSPIAWDTSPRGLDDASRNLRMENLRLKAEKEELAGDMERLTVRLETSEQQQQMSRDGRVEQNRTNMAKKVTFSEEVQPRSIMQPLMMGQQERMLQALREKDAHIRRLMDGKKFYEEVFGDLCQEAGLFELDRDEVI